MGSPFRLDWCSYAAVVYACNHWHYSKSVPVGKLVKIGAWERNQYIGCVVYGRGANYNLGRPYGLKQTQICELVRVALDKHETPTSRIVAQSIQMLKKKCPHLRLIISYADKNQGHVGTIYQASNWLYVGPCKVAPRLILNGKSMHARSVHKKYGTSSLAWLRQQVDPHVKRATDQGRHKYLMPLDRKMRKQLLPFAKKYPKK